MEHLTDEGIELLGRKASAGLSEFNAYLDDITGAAEARQFGDLVQSSLLHRPSLFASALNTMHADSLLNVVRKGDIMDRLTACLRILRIPGSQLPSDVPFDLMEAAQRHLSGILVDQPVLMHNRIMVKGHHFARSEFGPIATVLAETPRAEFPRLSHGISPERLQAFARHPCVRVGLMQEAPNALREKEMKLQGRTMLNAVVVSNSFTPRARMLGSILELDAARASKGKRVASLLTCKGATEVALRGCFANSFMAQCGLGHMLAPDLQQPAPDFLDALKSSGVADESWFLRSIELRLQRWATVSLEAQPSSLMAIARGLDLCQPAALSSAAGPSSVAPAVRWLISAMLDTSSDRAASLGEAFKGFPFVGVDSATAFIEVVDELDPVAAGNGQIDALLVTAIGASAPVAQSQPWLAAIRAHAMRRVIASSATGPSPVALAAPAPVLPRRSLAI